MMCYIIRCNTAALLLLLRLSGVSALSILPAGTISPTLDRRTAIATAISTPFLLLSDKAQASSSSNASSLSSSSSLANAAAEANSQNSATIITNPNPRAITTIRINSANENAGLELSDNGVLRIGTPPRNVLAVRSIRFGGQAAKAGAERGMILLDYGNKQDLVQLIARGRYPIEIRLYNLALGGDAMGDLGRSIVTPQDALDLAASLSNDSKTTDAVGGGLTIDTTKKANGECSIKSRRGDTMQIRYEARIGNRFGPIYDSSEWRGTGQPFYYVLGNNDVLKGVDLGTFDMCPGEKRELTIPPELGYQNRSKMYLYGEIPENSQLFWSVELVELNFVKEGANDKPRDEDYY